MTTVPIRAGRRRDALIASLVVGAVVVVLLVLHSLHDHDDVPPPTTPAELKMTWTVRPAGFNGSMPPLAEVKGRNLALYLDVSQPMAGFLPPPSRSQELSGFRSVVQLVQDHLVSAAGGSGSQVQWFGVAADASPMKEAPRIERRLFQGKETRLDRALDRLTRSLAQGEVAAAALITDLNASNGLTGAMGALRPLSAWIESAAVRGGGFHAGLLGVRASYWGVPGHGCAVHGDLGCWFSERRNAYRPLSGVVQVPFYVLVLGRGRQAVEDIGDRVRHGAERLGLKPEWELLSAASLPRTVAGTCQLTETGHEGEPPQQFALARSAVGDWECVQGDRVELSCELPPDGALAGPRLEVSWPGPGVEVPDPPFTMPAKMPGGSGGGRQGVRIVLNCEQLRERPPTGALTLRLVGSPQASSESPWLSWTSVTDEREQDLAGTPELAYFVDRIRLRPHALELVSSPLMRMTGAERRR
jgi:hypothetical protein